MKAPSGTEAAAVFGSAGTCPPQLAMPASMETLQCDDALKASEADTWVTEEPRKLGSLLHFPSEFGRMRSTFFSTGERAVQFYRPFMGWKKE